MTAALRFEDLTVAYDRHPAVHHLTGAFERGSLTAIVGPNGGGKSTLLKAAVGLMRPDSGRIDRGGVPAARIAYLPQYAELDRSFPMSVADAVGIGHWGAVGVFGGLSGALRRRVAEALETVGLGGFEARPVSTLSTGQFQRALFARLMLQDAALILLDEPFSAIDTRTTCDLIGVLERWRAEGRTVVAVLHDLHEVREHFPNTLLLARECIAWGPTAETLTPANLDRARNVSAAWDDGAEICARAA